MNKPFTVRWTREAREALDSPAMDRWREMSLPAEPSMPAPARPAQEHARHPRRNRPKQPKELVPDAGWLMMVTLPVWVPLFFLALILYIPGVLVVGAVRLAWDLVRIIGDERHAGFEKLLALAILGVLLYFGYEAIIAVATLFGG